MTFVIIVNIGIIMSLLFHQIRIMINIGIGYFRRFYSLVDLVYITTNMMLAVLYAEQLMHDQRRPLNYEHYVKNTRLWMSIGTMINCMKAGYYL